MKLIETLTSEQKLQLLSGNVVGIFPSMVLSTDVFYDALYDMCLGYYMSRSGEKTISPAYTKIINLIKENQASSNTAEELIGKLVRGKFLDKWKRIYSALVSEEYNALNNYDFTSHREGNNTDTTEYDTAVVDDGKVGIKEVVSRTSNDINKVYGFNSTEPVGDTSFNEDGTQTTEGKADDNTTHNTSTKTGTDTKTFGLDETISKSGREGSGADLIEKEIKLRIRNTFFDIVYSDIDSIATLQIYI